MEILIWRMLCTYDLYIDFDELTKKIGCGDGARNIRHTPPPHHMDSSESVVSFVWCAERTTNPFSVIANVPVCVAFRKIPGRGVSAETAIANPVGRQTKRTVNRI